MTSLPDLFLHIFSLIAILAYTQNIFIKSSSSNAEVLNRSMFPGDFLFGVATSAYQIEGGYLEDGKGLNNWDVFTRLPGTISDGSNGDVADDHYNRWMEDVATLENLGVNAYRFSISWTRILPKGRFGGVNPAGIIFYSKIIDNLLMKGIEPFVTIQHNDIPQELEDKYGGWLSSSIQDDYAFYAKTCFENFGGKVKYWSTINEPNILAEMAYTRGIFPPGHCSPPFGNCTSGNSDVEPLIAVHNMLLSHAKAVKLYRNHFQPSQHGYIGMVVSAQSYVPYRDDDFSNQAVERAFANSVAWILDPLIYGDYPPLMRKYHGKELPKFNEEETNLIRRSIDFIGLNHYSTQYAIDCSHNSNECTSQDSRAITGFVAKTGYRDGIPIGKQQYCPAFFVVPEGMEQIVDYIRVRYPNITIYVTENGYSPPSRSDSSEMLQDFERVTYYQSYISSLTRAMRKGAKVKGYFAWTLMDNFEWSDGYESTYGLYYVDRTTLERLPKLSAKWYAGFLRNEGGYREITPSTSLQLSTTKAEI